MASLRIIELHDQVKRLSDMVEHIESVEETKNNLLLDARISISVQACIGSMFLQLPATIDDALPRSPRREEDDAAFQQLKFCVAMGYRTLVLAIKDSTIDVYDIKTRFETVADAVFEHMATISDID